MRSNDKCLVEYSLSKPDYEGRLNHKKAMNGTSYSQKGFKERWFKLKANLLFYFKINDLGQIENQPAGLLVLENSCVQYESRAGLPFAFSISFRDDLERKHILSAGTEDHVCQWISVLKHAAYEHWRSQLIVLQTKISQLTGNDPSSVYPRNRGVVRNVSTEEDNETPVEKFKSHLKFKEPETTNLIDL